MEKWKNRKSGKDQHSKKKGFFFLCHCFFFFGQWAIFIFSHPLRDNLSVPTSNTKKVHNE